MQKIIVSLDLYDDRCKQKAMKSVSGISGVDSVSIDMKDKKLTVVGDVDAILIVKKLRRHCHTTIVSVGPAKEPEKKKQEPKKEEPKKIEYAYTYGAYNPHIPTHYYDNAMFRKIIVSLELHDDRCKQKAMKSVSGISGVDSLSIDYMKDNKLTVIGDVEAILIVKKLRRHCHTTIVSVGPAKEPEKKKEEPKKEEPKKIEYAYTYGAYNPHIPTHYYDNAMFRVLHRP
ncbi:hypothetical protein MKW98_014912 [Papaver atlanticum]|uniref:HMA domain-containing protein n=1 Tax=Papaver atlanticum TaxID=357466 RepID=A0AAD4T2Q2_9MAGN|nr:hypothetical protein MKW98_014912 [Papaver atlanticum]